MSFIDIMKIALPIATTILGSEDGMANPIKQENPYRSTLKNGIKILDEVTRECDMERQQTPVVPTTSQNIVYDQYRTVTPVQQVESVQLPQTVQYIPPVAQPVKEEKKYAWDVTHGYRQL